MTFKWKQYKMLNPDLEKNGIKTELEYTFHYNKYGKNENRLTNIYQLYPDFNWMQYRNNYMIRDSLTNNLNTMEEYEDHWLEYGRYRNKINQNINTITFITPTVGRLTLINTIKSVLNQTCNNWKYIIVFDGIAISPIFDELIKSDPRISSIVIEKTGQQNYAGIVRNKGIEIADSEWIGFVDDDDIISPLYVEYMNNYIYTYPKVECIIYRMICSENINKRGILTPVHTILPSPHHINFSKGYIGISFCYKLDLFKKGIKFEQDQFEDFILLDKIRKNKHMILLSNYICYFVKRDQELTNEYTNICKSIEKTINFLII